MPWLKAQVLKNQPRQSNVGGYRIAVELTEPSTARLKRGMRDGLKALRKSLNYRSISERNVLKKLEIEMISRQAWQEAMESAPESSGPESPESQAALEVLQNIRHRLKVLFDESGLTMKDVGMRMGKSEKSAPQYVSRLLGPNANPTMETVVDFIKAIGRDSTDFFNL